MFQRVQVGTDHFSAPIYDELPINVENVLVLPCTVSPIVSDLQLHGNRTEYELCIPKNDTNEWNGCRVDFFGQSWRVFAPPMQYIDSLVPLEWNRKVKVERYG